MIAVSASPANAYVIVKSHPKASDAIASINGSRQFHGKPKLKTNVWVTDFANAVGKRYFDSRGSSSSTEDLFLPNDVDGVAPDVEVTRVTYTKTSVDLKYGVFGSTVATYFWMNSSAAWDASTTYIGVSMHETSTKVYGVMVLTDYTAPPPGKIYSAKPTISGSGRVGEALTAKAGSWTPSGVSFSYSWLVDGVEVSTDKSYTPSAVDLGKSVVVVVAGTKPGYVAASTRSSSAKGITLGLPHKGTVTVAGNRNVGQTLTANPGTWAPVDTAFTYQWLRSGSAIVGETNDSYELTVADYGKKIDVKITGSATAYSSASLRTYTSTTTKHPLLDVASTPVIVGDPTYMQVLTADVGDWQPAPVTLSYQWRINGKAVYNATKPAFTVPSSAVGKAITVTVTGSHLGYSSVSRTSEPTEIVASLPFTIEGDVTVSGLGAVGKTLTAHPGTWSPSASFTYRWYRDGVPISMATASTYKVTSSSATHSLSVTVTAKRAGYTTTPASSEGISIP